MRIAEQHMVNERVACGSAREQGARTGDVRLGTRNASGGKEMDRGLGTGIFRDAKQRSLNQVGQQV